MTKVRPILIDMRTLRDKAFDEIKKAKGKKQDRAITDLAVFLAVVEASGGKKEVAVTEKQIAERYEDLYLQVLFEFSVRTGILIAKYDKRGRIVSMKSTEKGLKEAERILKQATKKKLK